MFRQINYYIQIFWILAVAMLLGIQLFYQNGRLDELILPYLLFAFFMGLNQLITSLVHVLKHSNQSALRYHLILSFIFLAVSAIIGTSELKNFLEGWEMEQVMVVFWIPPGLLTLYFWYLTFTEFNLSPNTNHSYLDL